MNRIPRLVLSLALLLVTRGTLGDVPEGPPTGTRSALSGPTDGGTGGGGAASTLAPDLFTGAFTTAIPMALPGGAGRATPDIALRYTAGGGNGWVGVGWELELGAIERRTRRGVAYDRDDYLLKLGGAAVELVQITAPSGTEYRARIESAFLRVVKSGAGWVVTDRAGTKYYFGQAVTTRQYNPTNSAQTFRWCLDRVEDVHGNFWTATYFQTSGAIYPVEINYGWRHRPHEGVDRLARTASTRVGQRALRDTQVYAWGRGPPTYSSGSVACDLDRVRGRGRRGHRGVGARAAIEDDDA